MHAQAHVDRSIDVSQIVTDLCELACFRQRSCALFAVENWIVGQEASPENGPGGCQGDAESMAAKKALRGVDEVCHGLERSLQDFAFGGLAHLKVNPDRF